MFRRRWVPRSARPVAAVAAGSWRAAGNQFRKLAVPPPVPMERFTRRVRVQIGNNGIAQTVVAAGGAAVAAAGPQAHGTHWFPQQVTIATATGPADASTCLIYLGAVVPQNIVATSYAGGGDVLGLAVPEMQPGDLLYAVWAGGQPGDWATMTVIGQQEILVAA